MADRGFKGRSCQNDVHPEPGWCTTFISFCNKLVNISLRLLSVCRLALASFAFASWLVKEIAPDSQPIRDGGKSNRDLLARASRAWPLLLCVLLLVRWIPYVYCDLAIEIYLVLDLQYTQFKDGAY